MVLGQTIIPIYLPMPDCGDIPAEEANIVLILLIGSLCLLIGFAIGLWLHDKIFN